MREEPAEDSKREILITSAIVMMAFFGLYAVMKEDQAFFTAILIGNIYVVGRMKFYLWKKWWFWSFLILISLIHLSVILFLGIRSFDPPIFIWPFAILDGIFIYYILYWLERKLQ